MLNHKPSPSWQTNEAGGQAYVRLPASAASIGIIAHHLAQSSHGSGSRFFVICKPHGAHMHRS